MRHIAAALLVLAGASTAWAQSNTLVTPSVSIGALYDENILWADEAQSDHVWSAQPRLQVLSETVRSRLWLETSLNTTWYSRHRSLSSALARQQATTEWSWQATPASEVGLGGSYYNTTDPADVDPTTGWSFGRRRTVRWGIAPDYTITLAPRWTATVRYALGAEYARDIDDLMTQTAEVDFGWRGTERDELRVAYALDHFSWQEEATRSHRGEAYWVRRVTPLTQMMIGAGVRVHEGDLSPVVDFALNRRTPLADATVSYSWSQTAALGVRGLLDSQRLLGTARYGRPGWPRAGVHGGVYLNRFGGQSSRVWRAGVDVLQPIVGPLALGVAYSFDYQQSRLPLPTDVTDPPFGPPVPLGREARRSVFSISLVLTGPEMAALARGQRPVDLVRDPHAGGSQ